MINGSTLHYVFGAISVLATAPFLPGPYRLLSLLLPTLVGIIMEGIQYMGWRSGKEKQTWRNAIGDVMEYFLGGVYSLAIYTGIAVFNE